jgi:hypothetical protein
MTNGKESNNSVWQNLEWEKKVSICNQGISAEDGLLLNLVIMFIAFEAILFTIFIGVGWGQYWSIVLAFLGIGVIILYMYLFEKRGKWVDHWGEILFSLWKDAGDEGITNNYLGCVERINKRKEKYGWWKVMFGWCEKVDNEERFKRVKYFISWFRCFNSTRRLLTTFIPLILIIIWVLVMVLSLVC